MNNWICECHQLKLEHSHLIFITLKAKGLTRRADAIFSICSFWMKFVDLIFSDSTLIRMLLDGYRPREASDMAFHEDMNRLMSFSDYIEAIGRVAGEGELREKLMEEAEAISDMRRQLMEKYLLPEKM